MYSEVTEKIALKDITFEELRENYVLPSANPDLRTPVPTLEELLVACRNNDVMPLLHSDVEESYAMATRMFGDKWIAFCSSAEMLKKARSMSDCLVLLDISAYPTIDDVFNILEEIGGRCGVSTMDYFRLTPDFCSKPVPLRQFPYPVPEVRICQRYSS